MASHQGKMKERKRREDKLVTGRSLAFMILVRDISFNWNLTFCLFDIWTCKVSTVFILTILLYEDIKELFGEISLMQYFQYLKWNIFSLQYDTDWGAYSLLNKLFWRQKKCLSILRFSPKGEIIVCQGSLVSARWNDTLSDFASP